MTQQILEWDIANKVSLKKYLDDWCSDGEWYVHHIVPTFTVCKFNDDMEMTTCLIILYKNKK